MLFSSCANALLSYLLGCVNLMRTIFGLHNNIFHMQNKEKRPNQHVNSSILIEKNVEVIYPQAQS